jgi:hypothetical protein
MSARAVMTRFDELALRHIDIIAEPSDRTGAVRRP